MADIKVTLRIPTGKNTYVFSFRHPMVKDPNGNGGKKVQRGAGTSDLKRAEELVEQLSLLLNEERWHDKAMKGEAQKKFDSIVVDAFYDPIPDVVEQNDVLDIIPMKSIDDGYMNESLVGMSGAGKTSLLRKEMGTTEDVFPTTSTNRTTTCDMEIIRSDISVYRMAVKFMTRRELEADLQDNIRDAIEYIYFAEKEEGFIDDIELLTTIFNHSEMSTRLTYTFGLYDIGDEDYDDDDSFDDDLRDDFSLPEYNLDAENKDKWLRSIENRVKNLAETYRNRNLEIDDIENCLQEDDDVLLIIEDIISAIVDKFSIISGGRKLPAKSTWPDGWYFETEDRSEFLKTAKIFVSDSYKAWGNLLTPIVKAMRIEGPFIAEGKNSVEPKVITDGMGLGHTTDSTAIPTSVLKRCEKADVIVFADSASNPMMANTKEALKSLIEHGYADRIIFAFTKMDQVTGNNYRNLGDKKRHVRDTLQNYLSYLRRQESTVLSDSEMQSIISNCVFFSNLNKKMTSNLTNKGLIELDRISREIANKHVSTDNVHFKYDALKLYFYVKEATAEFRNVWAEKTGYSSITNKTEHWTRIRALSRRLGVLGQENYCELQPLADFSGILQKKINIFFNEPGNITPEFADEATTDALKQILKRSVGIRLSEMNKERMWTDKRPLNGWINAYNEMGKGSRNRRARIIEGIFDEAAPNLSDIPNLTEDQNKYLSDVIQIVKQVLSENGCELKMFNY